MASEAPAGGGGKGRGEKTPKHAVAFGNCLRHIAKPVGVAARGMDAGVAQG